MHRFNVRGHFVFVLVLMASFSLSVSLAQPPKPPRLFPPRLTEEEQRTTIESPPPANDPLAAIVADLSSDVDDKKLLAIEKFAGLGTFVSEQVTNALINLLNDSNEFIRFSAMRTLGLIGQDASAALPRVSALANEATGEYERQLATWTAAKLVDDRVTLAKLVPASIASLESQDESVAHQAAQTLLALGRVAHSDLIARLNDGNDATAPVIIELLGASGAREAVAPLVQRLSSDDVSIRLASIDAIGEIGPASRIALPFLLELLNSESDERVRAASARSLGGIGVAAPECIAALTKHASDASELVALQAIDSYNSLPVDHEQRLLWNTKWADDLRPAVVATAFANLSELGLTALPALRTGLEDPSKRVGALIAIGDMGMIANESLPDVLSHTHDPSALVRQEVWIAVAKLAGDSSLVVKDLPGGLRDNELSVQQAATFTAGSLAAQSGEILSALRTNQRSGDALLRMLSSWAMANCDPSPVVIAQSTGELANGLFSSEPALRNAAAMCIGNLRLGKASIQPLLLPSLAALASSGDLQSLNDNALLDFLEAAGAGQILDQAIGNPMTRPLAVVAAARLKEKAALSLPSLLAALNDDRKAVRRDVVLAIADIGPTAEAAIEPLRQALREDESVLVRRAAAIALGHLGTQAAAATPDLTSALMNEELQSEAAWALANVTPEDAKVAAMILPQLLKDLNADRSSERLAAAKAIQMIGDNGSAAVSALRYAADDSDLSVRSAARLALNQLGVALD